MDKGNKLWIALAETIDMAKIRVYVTVREDLVKWVDQKVEELMFANRSHAVEYALLKLKEGGGK